MLKMLVEGKISEKELIKGKNGKDYPVLYVIVGKKIVQVTVPLEVYSKYEIFEDVSLECDFFVNYEKKYTSLYIK